MNTCRIVCTRTYQHHSRWLLPAQHLVVLALLCLQAHVVQSGAASHHRQGIRRRQLDGHLDENVFVRHEGKGGKGSTKGSKSYSKSSSSSSKASGQGHSSKSSTYSSKSGHSKSGKRSNDLFSVFSPNVQQAMESSPTVAPNPAPVVVSRTIDDLLTDVFGRQVGAGGGQECKLNDKGIFGDAEAPGSDVYTIQYFYQVSVLRGTSPTQISDLVIPALDNAVTTAILPSFFDCSVSASNRRKLQQQPGVVEAISKLPPDTLIRSGDAVTCPKSVLNSDCYIAQGSNTVVARGFRSKQVLSDMFSTAVQGVMQGDALLGELETTLILDTTALSDDRQTLPPIIVPTRAPVVSPVVVPTTIDPTPSVPVATRAPAMPQFDFPSFIQKTDAPTRSPGTLSPVIGGTNIPTGIPTGSPMASPTILATPAPDSASNTPSTTPAAVATQSPVLPPPTTAVQDTRSSRNKPEWWVWFLAAIGACMLLLCLFAVVRCGIGGSDNNSHVSPIGNSSPAATSGANSGKNSAARLGIARHDTDPDDAYEPPPTAAVAGSSYVPPGVGGFSVTEAATASATTSTPAGGFVVNDGEDDDEDSDESFTDEGEEEYVEEEEEVFDADDDYGDEEESFHDEEGSFYEEEEEESYEEEEPAGNWGTEQQTFGGRY